MKVDLFVSYYTDVMVQLVLQAALLVVVICISIPEMVPFGPMMANIGRLLNNTGVVPKEYKYFWLKYMYYWVFWSDNTGSPLGCVFNILGSAWCRSCYTTSKSR